MFKTRLGWLPGIWVWLIALVGLTADVRGDDAAKPAAAAREPALRKVKLLHLRVVGDFDNIKLVQDIAAVLADARSGGVELLVLEAAPQTWRADVLARLFDLLATAKVGPGGPDSSDDRIRLVVWLNDVSDARMGSAAAALAVAGHSAYACPKLELVHEPGDELRGLAPLETDWAGCEQTVRGVVWSRLNARGSDVLLAAAVPQPRQALWLVERKTGEAGPRLKVVDADPGTGAAGAMRLTTQVIGAATPEFQLKMTGEALAQLGVVTGAAREIGQILAYERLSARQTVRREIKSGLSTARKKLEDELATVDSARNHIDQSLDEAERLRGHDAARQQARAGQAAITACDEATRRLLECEKQTETYPELLRQVPPGQTSVGARDDRLAGVWAQAFQTRRQALVDLKARAERLTR